MQIEALHGITERLHHSESFVSIGKEPEFAILIPIVSKENKLYLLFEKRSQTVRQPGEICFPGGSIEPNDRSVAAAAVRETQEELGIDAKAITLLGKLGTLLNVQMLIHCFVGFISEESLKTCRYNQEEVEELLYVDIDELIKIEPKTYKLKLYADPSEIDKSGNEVVLLPGEALNLPPKYHKRWPMGYREIITYDMGNELIWGLTGQITKYFLDNFIR